MSDGEFAAVTGCENPSFGMGLTVAVAGSLATLTVSSPGPDLAEALCAARAALPGTVRVALLRIGGADSDDLLPAATVFDSDDDAALARWQQAFDWYSSPALVSVAAVSGAVGGELLRLALGADVRVLSQDASLVFGVPGAVPPVDHGRLVTLAGAARATELCLVGVTLEASAARAAGLANVVAGNEDLGRVAKQMCGRLAATDRDAAAEVKALLLNTMSGPRAAPAAAERDALRRLRNRRLAVERED